MGLESPGFLDGYQSLPNNPRCHNRLDYPTNMVRLSKARVLSVADIKTRLIQEMEQEDPTKSIVSLSIFVSEGH